MWIMTKDGWRELASKTIPNQDKPQVNPFKGYAELGYASFEDWVHGIR